MVLEDVHWADEATLDVLKLLGRRIDTVPALVAVTYRDDELDARHPLRLVIGDLPVPPAAQRVRLASLSREAVGALGDAHGVDGDELWRKQDRGQPVLRRGGAGSRRRRGAADGARCSARARGTPRD